MTGMCFCILGIIMDVGAECTVHAGDVGAVGTVDQKNVLAVGTVDQKEVVAAGTVPNCWSRTVVYFCCQ